MSIKYMSNVWGTPFSATEKLVLMYIANCANDEGLAYPGYKNIRKNTGLSESTIAKALYVLKGSGVLKVENHSHFGVGKKVNLYTITSLLEVINTSPLEVLGKIKDLRSHRAKPYTSPLEVPILHPSKSNTSPLEDETLVINVSKKKRQTFSSPPKSGGDISNFKFTPEDTQTADKIWKAIKQTNPGHRYPKMPDWADTIRLMRERDNRTHAQIIDLFTWANNHDFWKANILCPAKLRKQWDRLETQRIVENQKPSAEKEYDAMMQGGI